jgi:glc operon protein GlcG
MRRNERKLLVSGERRARPYQAHRVARQELKPFAKSSHLNGEDNMTVLRCAAWALAMVSALAGGSQAQSLILEKQVLSLAAARKIVAAAEADANRRGVGVVIAVVDSSGTLIELSRMDAAQIASVNVGIGKARTAAIYRRPSRDFEEQIKSGRIAALALADATPLQGGVPVLVDGRIVGAVGVSGDTPQVDEAIAIAGAAAVR